MPLTRRLPKRGFHNIFAKPLEIENLTALTVSDGAVVTHRPFWTRYLVQVPVWLQCAGQRRRHQKGHGARLGLFRFREGKDRAAAERLSGVS
jgi:hypothetical protein